MVGGTRQQRPRSFSFISIKCVSVELCATEEEDVLYLGQVFLTDRLFPEHVDSNSSVEQGRGPIPLQPAGVRLQEPDPESH